MSACALNGAFVFWRCYKVETKELMLKLIEIAPEGKISCTEARELAEKLGVQSSAVGKACNEAKIKIYGCELGCF